MSTSRSTKKRGLVDELLELDEDKPEGPAGEDGLTVKQAAFVRAFSDGPTAGHGTKSAVVAGYSQKSAPTIAVALQKLPHIVAAIDIAIRDKITQAMTARAVQLLGVVMDDDTQPMKLRAAIALKLADGSGVLQRAQIEKAKETGLEGGKALTDMSRGELENLVRQGAAVLKAAAALPPPGATIEGALAQNSAHALEDQSE